MNLDDLSPGAVLHGPDDERWLVDRRTWIERGGAQGGVVQLVLVLVRVRPVS